MQEKETESVGETPFTAPTNNVKLGYTFTLDIMSGGVD